MSNDVEGAEGTGNDGSPPAGRDGRLALGETRSPVAQSPDQVRLLSPGTWPQRVKAALFVILIALSVGLLVREGLVVVYKEQLQVHAIHGYCPQGTRAQRREGIRSPGHTIILIDTSNRISEEDGRAVLERIEAWARDPARAPYLQKLSIYGLPAGEHSSPVRFGDPVCIPKRDADWWDDYLPRVEAEFERFLTELRLRIESLRNREEAPQSPLVESMARLVQKYDDVDSFWLVSDMLQNTSIWNEYDGAEELTAEARARCEAITRPRPAVPPSSGAAADSVQVEWVELYHIRREDRRQPVEWPTPRWQECLPGLF